MRVNARGAVALAPTSQIVVIDAASSFTITLPSASASTHVELQFVTRSIAEGQAVTLGDTGILMRRSGDAVRLVEDGGQWVAIEDTRRLVPATLAYIVTGDAGKGSDLATGADLAFRLRPPDDMEVEEIFIEVLDAPTGAALIANVHNLTQSHNLTTNGDRPTIADGEKTGVTTDIAQPYVAKNDELRIDLIQVGSTNPGQDLTVHVRGKMRGT